MAGTGCTEFIALWGLGYAGECLSSEYGIRIGKTGYKYVTMEIHWNNVDMRSDLYDASAMRLYLTKKLRPNDGVIMALG